MDDLPEPAIPQTYPRTYGGNAAFHNFFNDYSHIQDPNLRRRLALSEIDKVPFGWYHVRAVVVAGIGFFTDSYDIFAINLVTSTLGMVYWHGSAIPGSNSGGNDGKMPTAVNTAIKASTSGGAVIGQMGFGWLADVVGRRKMYGVELAIIVMSTLAQALSAPSSAVTLTGLLIFWRVVMGIGIGGDYPLSSVITSEFAPTRWRGAMMAAVFSMQGAGQLAAAIVALITTIGFKESFLTSDGDYSKCEDACRLAGDKSWRIVIGFGAVPACFALYYRITIPETPRYTFDVKHDIEKAQADIKAYVNNKKNGKVDPISQETTKRRMGKHLASPKASWPDVFTYFSKWENFKIIFGTTMAWFFLDLAFYGLSLNNSEVLNAIGYSTGGSIYENLRNTAVGNLILVCAGSMPGYWLSVVTIDTLGRKPIQIGGFFFLTIIFIVLGFALDSLSEGALLTLYIFAQFFFNFGPNTTTFIVPGECFPTRYRSTGHGLSAAMGKIGAIIAQVLSQFLLNKDAPKGECGRGKSQKCAPWLNHLLQIFSLFMLCGFLVSFLIPETKGRTLEELAGEASMEINNSGPSSSSLADGSGWKGWWARNNPFTGGAPAGFNFVKRPNLGPRSPGIRGKRERMGIMMSPELIPKTKQKGKDSGSEGSGSNSGSRRGKHGHSVSVERADEQDDLYLAGAGGALPGWGAGWGVQRNGGVRGDGRVDSVLLQDVGKLLK